MERREPFKAILDGDRKAPRRRERRRRRDDLATHAGMTTDDFDQHRPRLDRHGPAPPLPSALHRVVYQPMLELLAYLRANGFKTLHRLRRRRRIHARLAEQVYGIPPEQVAGSSSS